MRRLLSLLAQLVAFFLFRRVEVVGREEFPRDQPVLIVANHFYGLIDPVLVAASVPGTPRFLAKATLARILGVGSLLRACGVIFVHRQVDGAGTTGNVHAFDAAHEALRKGDTVAIFPEGTTHDRPHLDPVRTGAARIALGARQAGARDLVILPVGLTFADKVSLRSVALVTFGAPMALDELAAEGAGPHDRAAVATITGRIEQALRQVSPDFPDVETWLALDQAAEVATRTERRLEPSLAARADLARRMVHAPDEAREAVKAAVGRYATVLAGLRIDDRDVVRPADTAGLLRRAVGTGLFVVALGSLVGATIVVNAIPSVLVASVSLLVTKPVSKGTARALVGLVAFPTAWFTAAALAVDGVVAIGWLALISAAGAASAVLLVERTLALVEAILRWRLSRERVAVLGEAAAIRADVLAAVEVALAT